MQVERSAHDGVFGQWIELLSGGRVSFRYHFIESLILAQDERWRRA